MLVQCDQDQVGVVCRLTGNLENATVGELGQAVVQFAPKSHVIFSLQDVPFIDSAGLGALIGAIRRIREMSGEAVVCSPRPSVDRVVQIVGLPRIVDVFGTVSDAKAYLQGKRLRPGVDGDRLQGAPNDRPPAGAVSADAPTAPARALRP